MNKLSVDDVMITEELARRAPRKVDYQKEKAALLDLAARMIDQPSQLLPRFVDLAMEMTGGVSAGLSLYEENPAPGVFRWQYLRGILAPFNGATTPRNFSPCGITLDRNAPVLSMHPERFYDWISDANIVVPEVLLVPLYIGSSAPLGTLWIVAEKEGHFDSGHARVITELASFVGIALSMVRTERRLKGALEEQATLAKEMSHRVKNLFAIAEGMIRLTAKSTDSKDEMVKALTGRLHALASAHALVRRDFSKTGISPRVTDLGDLIRTVTAPHNDSSAVIESRFVIDGPFVRCGDHAMNGLALVFHELATNAAKYGALTSGAGIVDVGWRLEQDRLIVCWAERGGPRIAAAPGSMGFGSSLVETTVVHQLGGQLDYDWRPDGLTVTLSIPADRLDA